LLRSILIGIAQTGIFRAQWTRQINEEWIRELAENRPDLSMPNIRRTADLMNKAIRDCLIEGHENLIECLELPDPNDRHVLAAAIQGRADAIVTFNLKDFPAAYLEKYQIEPLHPDDFLINQIDLVQGPVLPAIHEQRTVLKNPPISAEDLVSNLEKRGLPQTAARLRSLKMLI